MNKARRSRRRWLLSSWLAAAVVLGGALLAAQHAQRPLDDPDLAMERPGFLDAHGSPFPAPALTAGLPAAGARTVLFFTRPERFARLAAALTTANAPQLAASVAVIVSDGLSTSPPSGFLVLVDQQHHQATAYHMPVPRDGSPPVGYAIVDSHGRVRYRTLDPNMDERLREVQTMVRATP